MNEITTTTIDTLKEHFAPHATAWGESYAVSRGFTGNTSGKVLFRGHDDAGNYGLKLGAMLYQELRDESGLTFGEIARGFRSAGIGPKGPVGANGRLRELGRPTNILIENFVSSVAKSVPSVAELMQELPPIEIARLDPTDTEKRDAQLDAIASAQANQLAPRYGHQAFRSLLSTIDDEVRAFETESETAYRKSFGTFSRIMKAVVQSHKSLPRQDGIFIPGEAGRPATVQIMAGDGEFGKTIVVGGSQKPNKQ